MVALRDMSFVLDENLPRSLAHRLSHLSRAPVEHALDYCDPGAPDEDLKALSAEQGLVVITREWKFVPSQVTRQTYVDKGVSALILVGPLGGGPGGATLAQLHEWFREYWEQIEERFSQAETPIVIRAHRDGRLVVADD